MKPEYKLWSWRGVDIWAHWSILLGLPWMYYRTRSIEATLLCTLGFFVLLFAHELGHAVVAHWRRVPVHYIRLFIFHGYCVHDQPWREKDEVWIAWGGVAAQSLFVLPAWLAGRALAAAAPEAWFHLWPLLNVFVEVNLFMIVFNLLPIAPLDGARAWRVLPLLRDWVRSKGWLPSKQQRKRKRHLKLVRSSQQESDEIIRKLQNK